MGIVAQSISWTKIPKIVHHSSRARSEAMSVQHKVDIRILIESNLYSSYTGKILLLLEYHYAYLH